MGADSTATFGEPVLHFYNHNQKIYEIGNPGTLGILTWGWVSRNRWGGLQGASYRTLAARLAADIKTSPSLDVLGVAKRWATLFHPLYQADPSVVRYRTLSQKVSYDPANPGQPNSRDEREEKTFTSLGASLPVGFCIAGRTGTDLTPFAYQVGFHPLAPIPNPDQLQFGKYWFWGVPDVLQRLYGGYDLRILTAILASGKWNGTPQELNQIFSAYIVDHPTIPIRDAVDFVYSSIYTTIKTLKFSASAQVCGGPIELAVITTDRAFRWVRHKAWDAAITDGEQP